MEIYKAKENRYETMKYRRTGNSGLLLPALSLGLWHNFGSVDRYENSKKMLEFAFDKGITHFDLANNYGPEPGSAETTFGQVMKESLGAYRDELIISTKAGYLMWPGPYGDFGSKKYLVASLNQSLKRMGLDYVDIFYHHRPDYDTPLEETMQALDLIVRQGKALYVGISNYPSDLTQKAAEILKSLGTPFVINQVNYSMINRWVEEDNLLDTLKKNGLGCIAFSPLAQGLLTDRYLDGIPKDSRMAREVFLTSDRLSEKYKTAINELNQIAQKRGQSIAQLAVAWLLKDERVTSVLVGASSTNQLANNLEALNNLDFSQEELAAIEKLDF